jgi:phage replication O-like protein O
MQLEQPLAGYNGSPQIEDGFTRIANELLHAIISFGFTKIQLLIIFSVIRMTYGYGKKQDALSGWQMSTMTGIDRSNISKTIDSLVSMNVLIKYESGRLSHGVFVHDIALNKYYDNWITVGNSTTVVKITPLVKQPNTVGNSTTQPLVKQPTHKERNKTKEIYIEVLDYLNRVAGKKFEPVDANINLIKARLKESSKEELLRVIDMKTAEWLHDSFMNKYLRPATLFNATKFASYIGEQSMPTKKERGLVL